MKILALEYGRSEVKLDGAIACYPDNTLLRNNDDFYIPNFSKEIVAYVGVYIHFTKIGKCLEPRFVGRYFDEVGVGIKFMAADAITRNQSLGLPADFARCFDSSFAISNDKVKLDDDIQNISLQVFRNKKKVELNMSVLTSLSEVVSTATKYFTIKIGDLFFVPCMKMPLQISLGDVFDVSLQQQQLLTCTVK